ncbi:MAG TPA: NlpC/P60 family protein [Bacillales bacterium]
MLEGLVFFKTYKVQGHVGIYLGHNRFIGAQASSGVAIESMKAHYWKKRFHGIVRCILPEF